MKTKNILWTLFAVALFSLFCCNTRGYEFGTFGTERPLLAESKIGVYSDPLLAKLTDALLKDYAKFTANQTNVVKGISVTVYPSAGDIMRDISGNKLEASISPRAAKLWTEDSPLLVRDGTWVTEVTFAYLNENKVHFAYAHDKSERWEPFAEYLVSARAQNIVREQGFAMLPYSVRK